MVDRTGTQPQMKADYLQLNLFNEAFAAYPKGLRLSKDIWKCYPLRGRGRLRRLLRVLNHTCADLFLLNSSGMPLIQYGVDGDKFCVWLDGVLRKPYSLCFFWPSPARSTGRLYAYAVDPSGGELLAYLKIAVSEQERKALIGEVKSCNLLQNSPVRSFCFPRCWAYEAVCESCAVAVFEPLPLDAGQVMFGIDSWNKRIGTCQSEISKGISTVPVLDLVDERWYHQFLTRSDQYASFTKAVMDTFHKGVDVCRTHGDFACHNFRESTNKLWIIDWEEYTERGPCLADEICFFLCVRRYELGWAMDKVYESFKQAYFLRGETVQRQAIQALAFLFGLKISMGHEMVDCWNRQHG